MNIRPKRRARNQRPLNGHRWNSHQLDGHRLNGRSLSHGPLIGRLRNASVLNSKPRPLWPRQ